MLRSKAVSEVLGYILILSVVVATVTVIYAAGMPAIRSQEDLAVFRSMENTFYVLQNVERLVAYNITPVKSVSIRAEGGTIVVVPNWAILKVEVFKGGGNSLAANYTYKYGAIVYLSRNGKAIILDNGAILECYGSRCFMVSYPRILRWNNSSACELYISLINVTGSLSFVGYKNILFRNINTHISTYTNQNPPVDTVNISIEVVGASKLGLNSTAIADAWINYFKSIGGEKIRVGPGKGKSKFNYSKIYITIGTYNITVSG